MTEEKAAYTAGGENVTPAIKEGTGEAEVRKASKIKAKKDAEAKRYWNTMITRGEAKMLVERETQHLSNVVEMLTIQNRTLLDVLVAKNVATLDEINEISKGIIQSTIDRIESEMSENSEQ